jgi:Na+(H+)/acetate symporter ActP
MKNKSWVCWLSLLGGPFGLARFFMFGLRDSVGWALLFMSLLGIYGFERAQSFGLDDPLSWWLVPLLGLSIAISAMHTLYWGLMSAENWNMTYNPGLEDAQARQGKTNWLTVGALVLALMLGTTALLSSLAYGFQRYFESQIEEARRLSQSSD